jgi:hypothetical protein
MVPDDAAVHLYQMDLPPPLPAWTGSPGSAVAPTVLPEIEPKLPIMTVALEKLSLTGRHDCLAV